MVWLCALVGRERRIEVLSLHGANRPRNVAITNILNALEGAGDILQEQISVLHSQRTGRLKDSGELCVGEADWPHACPMTAERQEPRLTLEQDFSQRAKEKGRNAGAKPEIARPPNVPRQHQHPRDGEERERVDVRIAPVRRGSTPSRRTLVSGDRQRQTDCSCPSVSPPSVLPLVSKRHRRPY